MEPQKVRAKFKCNEITTHAPQHDGKNLYSIKMSAVYADNNPENKEFFKWTPTANLEMSFITPDLFKPGQEYYLDFIPVPKE